LKFKDNNFLNQRNYLQPFKKTINEQWILYVFLLPSILAVFIFNYIPMYGVVMSFQKYNINLGIVGSEFIGINNFISFLSDSRFHSALLNTVWFGIIALISFPVPILFAILLNEYKYSSFRRIVQSVTYLPYFMSWVIISGMIYRILDQDSGVINSVLSIAGIDSIPFLRKPELFRYIYFSVSLWKETGWSAILYLSAMTAINPEIYEAAFVDGANRFRRIWHVTLPGIKPTIVLLLILRVSAFFYGNFEAIFALRNPMLSSRSDNVELFTYFRGVMGAEYGYATSIGLSQSILAIIILFIFNKSMKKLTGYSLF